MDPHAATQHLPLDLERRAIAGARRGDWDAVHFLYVRHSDEVRRFVGSIVDSSHADEVTQSIFAGLLSSIGDYERYDMTFIDWLMRIARRTATEHQVARPRATRGARVSA